MGNYTIFGGFQNPRRGSQARNLTTNVPKILDLKSSSEQIFSENCRWVPLNEDNARKVITDVNSTNDSSHEKTAESATAECADYTTRITSDAKEQPVNLEAVKFD